MVAVDNIDVRSKTVGEISWIQVVVLEVVEGLLKALSQDAEKTDSEGDLPPHKACRHHPEKEVVEALLKAFPQAAEKADNKGGLPLHYVCMGNPEKEVVEVLLKVFPQAAGKAERKGLILCLLCEALDVRDREREEENLPFAEVEARELQMLQKQKENAVYGNEDNEDTEVVAVLLHRNHLVLLLIVLIS